MAGDDEFVAERREAFLDALCDDFNTPRALAAAVRAHRRGQPPPAPGRARGGARDAAAAWTRGARERGGAGATRRQSGSWPSASRRAPSATSSAPTACATSSPSAAGRSVTGPKARGWCGGRDRSRTARSSTGAGRLLEAKRGRRRVRRVWTADELSDDELTAPRGLAGPPGGGRRGRSVPLLRTRTRCSTIRRRWSSRSTRSRTPTTSAPSAAPPRQRVPPAW